MSEPQYRIAPCVCKHEFQDERYGKGQRVWNLNKKEKNTGPVFICTVCGARERP